jgi:hypothetical protein
MTETMIPLWMRNVISLCHAQGGKITSEEVANISATVKRFALGSTLITELKKNRHIEVKALGKIWGSGDQKIMVYSITRREVARATEHESRITAIS